MRPLREKYSNFRPALWLASCDTQSACRSMGRTSGCHTHPSYGTRPVRIAAEGRRRHFTSVLLHIGRAENRDAPPVREEVRQNPKQGANDRAKAHERGKGCEAVLNISKHGRWRAPKCVVSMTPWRKNSSFWTRF